MKEKGFFRLPSSVDFDVYGLSNIFAGARVLGQWDDDERSGASPLRESVHVYRVITHHFDSGAGASVSVHTVSRRSRRDGKDRYGFREAAGSALLHATWKANWCEPSVRTTLDTLEILSLADDDAAAGWDRVALLVAGTEVECHFHRVGQAWAAVVAQPDVVIAVSACLAEPDRLDVVAITDLSIYAARPWPRPSRSQNRHAS
jgi:hypothetical protein